MEFQWDAEKAEANVRKHGVRFEEAVTVFSDPLSMTFADPARSTEEHRFLLIGRAESGGTLVVVHAEVDDDSIRIISARPATRREKKLHEEETARG